MPHSIYLSGWWISREVQTADEEDLSACHCCSHSSEASRQAVLSPDSLAVSNTGLRFAVFIKLCVFPFLFIGRHLIYLITSLYNISLTLEAQQHCYFLKWNSAVWLNWLVVRTRWLVRKVWSGLYSSLLERKTLLFKRWDWRDRSPATMSLFSLFCPRDSGKKKLLQGGGRRILERSP